MIHVGDGSERHAIPRWSRIDVAKTLGETSPVLYLPKQESLIQSQTDHLHFLLQEWKTEKNLPLALEIISSKQMMDTDIDIHEISQFALQKVSKMDHPPVLLCEFLDLPHDAMMLPEGSSSASKTIAALKHSLNEAPYNALMWCELARNYLIVGQQHKSERALHIAMSIAPEHRTVIRAVSKFYSHTGDLDRGLYYLRKCPLIRYDPWILSSEIALSNEKGRSSRFVKLGQQMLEDRAINPAALSELASELGTMDFQNSNKRHGKRKLEIAKKSLHENAMAQMIWIDQNVCKIENIISDVREPKCNYEADAKRCMELERWADAIKIIRDWQNYQPFSKDPAMAGSFLAADYLGDTQTAIKLLETGLKSNPNDKGLLNNLVYSQIMAGNLEEAYNRIQLLATDLPKTEDDIMLTATLGLYHYRNGHPQIGSFYYRNAIDQANIIGQTRLAYRAIVYYAREEKRIGNDIAPLLWEIHDSKNKAHYQSMSALIDKFDLN